MSRWRAFGRTGLILLGLAVGLLVCGMPSGRSRESLPRGTDNLLGRVIPNAAVQTMDGSNVHLQEAIGREPAILAFVSAADVVGCGNHALELRILREHMPGLRALIVGVGPDTAALRAYFRVNRADAVLDPEGRLLSLLGGSRTPLLVLTDTARRVVLVDGRTGPASVQFPISAVVAQLAAITRSVGEESRAAQ